MASIVELPERTRAPKAEVLAEAESMERILLKQPEMTWVSDEIAYPSRTSAQAAGNRYKAILVDDKVIVDDRFKLGVKVFADGDKFRVAIAILSEDETERSRYRSESRRHPVAA